MIYKLGFLFKKLYAVSSLVMSFSENLGFSWSSSENLDGSPLLQNIYVTQGYLRDRSTLMSLANLACISEGATNKTSLKTLAHEMLLRVLLTDTTPTLKWFFITQNNIDRRAN